MPATATVLHAADFANDAARFILDQAKASIAARNGFCLGLSGGNTPRKVYTAMAQLGADLAWDKVTITFGDERCVPSDDPLSNYRMAKESLLAHVPIPESNVLRIRTELEPAAAADDYEKTLATLAGHAKYFVHDLLLLGVGGDGHTASLFPGTPSLQEEVRGVVLQENAPAPATNRISMTFPLINAARLVCFMVEDDSKAQVIREIMAGDPKHPASMVKPVEGEVTWVLGYKG